MTPHFYCIRSSPGETELWQVCDGSSEMWRVLLQMELKSDSLLNIRSDEQSNLSPYLTEQMDLLLLFLFSKWISNPLRDISTESS